MSDQAVTKRILIYLALAFGIPWTAALALYLTVGRSAPTQAAGTANTIFITTPMLAHIATRLITKEGFGRLWLRPNFRRGWRFYIAAWLLPLAAVAAGLAAYYLVFPQSFDASFGAAQKLFAGSPLGASSPWTLMLILTAQSLFVAAPINAIFSIGEEFGWRAYLLPRLMERFTGSESASGSGTNPAKAAAGARKAALLIGVAWGVWHWPLFLLSMAADPSMPIAYLLVYILFTCALSVLLCWVTLRSGSVWPASLGHGAVNAFAGISIYTLKGPANTLLGPLAGGLIGSLGFIALALALLASRRAFTGTAEASPKRARATAGT